MSPVASFFAMPSKPAPSAPRKPRADALRNRQRILDIAKQAFARAGANASLDDIAQEAGVGPGTLYRHFPTREDLLLGVYHSEIEKLAVAAQKLSQTMSPLAALRSWLLLFVDAIATKLVIAAALNTLVGESRAALATCHEQLQGALRVLTQRAIRSGEVRKDLDPMDLLRALVGVANVAVTPDWQPSARRLVDILLAGIRPSPDR
ncbi:MAG: TetR/AcrR family transcriptional regulator [Terriglobales bacterium]